MAAAAALQMDVKSYWQVGHRLLFTSSLLLFSFAPALEEDHFLLVAFKVHSYPALGLKCERGRDSREECEQGRELSRVQMRAGKGL